MKVLLLSPVPGVDPPCGDVTYTQLLLANPPPGVQYETYVDAIQRGTCIEHARRNRLPREILLTLAAKATNMARNWGILFKEPFRFLSIKPGEYDLIHQHVFSVAFRQLPCPLVVSNAAPLRSLYEDARGYLSGRIRTIEAIETGIARIQNVNHCSYYLPQVSRVIAFTDYLKSWYVERGICPADRIDVVPIFLPSMKGTVNPTPGRIGFIAKDFDAKGGPVLLKAFQRVREAIPSAELVIVGCPSRFEPSEAARRGITWIPYIPREQLLSEILPSFDLFAYPTQFDGQPLVVLEAMSMGIPIATSDYQAMPELVDHGRAGLISPVGDVTQLAANIQRLLDPETNCNFRKASRKHFEEHYSTNVVRQKLLASYEAAMKYQIRSLNQA